MKQDNKQNKGDRKIFVLDTSVILFDHQAIYSFQDNDIVIPVTVLEELDKFKKGHDSINFEARQFTRIIDRISENKSLNNWVQIDRKGCGRIMAVFEEMPHNPLKDANTVFGSQKNDHKILNVATRMIEENPGIRVMLISKDINLRIKAKSLNIIAEDFETGKVPNVQLEYSGKTVLDHVDPKIIDLLYSENHCSLESLKLMNPPPDNHYFILKNEKCSTLAYYNPFSKQIERIDKVVASRIIPRNAEQTFALHALLNPNIQLITLLGTVGTGKTLLSLAAALAQNKQYKQIFLARPIIPLSNKDMGFLSGNGQENSSPYMAPLYDNLNYIKSQYDENAPESVFITTALEQEKIVISPLSYIRGRSLSNVYFIVDEAQNLTPLEVKTIITRAGEGTKIVFTGDIYQIDTPYLDAQSNGLSYLIGRIPSNPIYAHVKLEKRERSELANLAGEFL